jgi:YidC/Oxa1 family membrane protein insertase
MNKQKRVLLLVLMIGLVITLSACSSGSTSMYEQPMGAPGGWGWLQWIIELMGEGLYIISQFFGGYYWIGLVVLTILVRSAGWPIYAKSNDTTMNMQLAQPDLNALQEKYKGRTDEVSQKKMQAEQMEIYKKYGINPLGCLLPFLQMPIFIAMYQVVRRVPLSLGQVVDGVTTRDFSDLNYGFLWVKDLGAADPLYILPALVGILMFLYQRYTMKKPDYLQNKKYEKGGQQAQTEKTMKFMSYFMVIMLVSIAITNAGIALYWVIGNAYQFLQTYINRKQGEKKFYAMKEKY